MLIVLNAVHVLSVGFVCVCCVCICVMGIVRLEAACSRVEELAVFFTWQYRSVVDRYVGADSAVGKNDVLLVGWDLLKTEILHE